MFDIDLVDLLHDIQTARIKVANGEKTFALGMLRVAEDKILTELDHEKVCPLCGGDVHIIPARNKDVGLITEDDYVLHCDSCGEEIIY